METHRYAQDAEGAVHIFHSLQAQERWVHEERKARREARTLTRREAEKRLGRHQVRRITRQRHPLHFVAQQADNTAADS